MNLFKIGIYPLQSEVKDLFRYKNGYLYCRENTRMIRWYKANKLGTFDKHHPKKPSRIQIDGKHYFIHRLIWIYFNGYLSKKDVITFIDNNSQNCKIENLKKISQKEYLKQCPILKFKINEDNIGWGKAIRERKEKRRLNVSKTT